MKGKEIWHDFSCSISSCPPCFDGSWSNYSPSFMGCVGAVDMHLSPPVFSSGHVLYQCVDSCVLESWCFQTFWNWREKKNYNPYRISPYLFIPLLRCKGQFLGKIDSCTSVDDPCPTENNMHTQLCNLRCFSDPNHPPLLHYLINLKRNNHPP